MYIKTKTKNKPKHSSLILQKRENKQLKIEKNKNEDNQTRIYQTNTIFPRAIQSIPHIFKKCVCVSQIFYLLVWCDSNLPKQKKNKTNPQI